MSQLVSIIIAATIMGSGLAGAVYGGYKGYGLPAAESQTARSNNVRGLYIIGGGPGFGGK